MKTRNNIIIFTIIMCIMMGITIAYFRQEEKTQIDIVADNNQLNQVISEISKGTPTEEIEKNNDCSIIFYQDELYKSRLMSATAEGAVILDYEVNGELIAKVVFAGTLEDYGRLKHKMLIHVMWVMAAVLIMGYAALAVIYFQYERPFQKLQNFAGNIARGNLEVPLKMEKQNYFGVFTESFDLMRSELKRAKENENRANASKKELVAELSHDMKTPIATIKATCEVMDASLARNGAVTPEYYRDKIAIMIKKSDMIAHLIDNMFHATLEELDTLKVNATEQPSSVLGTVFAAQQDFIEMKVQSEIPQCLIYVDVLRFEQVVDNLVNNANKYAGTGLWVKFEEKEKGICITVRDHGPGVAQDEILLLTQKYYKGSNGKEYDGAGLGLYLANYFMNKMGGSFHCCNDDGFVVELFLRKV